MDRDSTETDDALQSLLQARCTSSPSLYLNDSLTGGEWQPHEAGVVDGHDLVSDAELARASSRPAVHHVGQDDRGQNGPPSGLHDHHPQDLAFALL